MKWLLFVIYWTQCCYDVAWHFAWNLPNQACVADRHMCEAPLLCRLRSIAAHRDHFVQSAVSAVSIHVSVCLSSSLAFLIVTHSYVSQATHAFLRMLPLCSLLRSFLYSFAFVYKIDVPCLAKTCVFILKIMQFLDGTELKIMTYLRLP